MFLKSKGGEESKWKSEKKFKVKVEVYNSGTAVITLTTVLESFPATTLPLLRCVPVLREKSFTFF
jgi:hypothetical protein